MEPKKRIALRKRRHFRLRKKVMGTLERPRLAVFKSLKHFYAQVIDDSAGRTIAASCSLTPDLKNTNGKTETAKQVALDLAEKLKGAGVKKIVFDHGGFGYHGKIKVFADTLREQGMEF
jgi:large subunit ribosomal protein L18